MNVLILSCYSTMFCFYPAFIFVDLVPQMDYCLAACSPFDLSKEANPDCSGRLEQAILGNHGPDRTLDECTI